MASASSSATTWTTPERRPWVSGPPSRSMSTSSPVTERTTSGPVTKIRPSGARMTRSVRAGPYAAPPAAKPSTMEICGILPEAWVMAWKIRPTACSESTPSASRAPPECQMPRIGTRSCIARSYARTTTSQPSTPMAPPITVASEQKATTRQPLTVPTAASMPESSSGVISSTEPGSSRACSRKCGLRGSCSRGTLTFAGGRAAAPMRAGGPFAVFGGGAMMVMVSLLWRTHW